MEALNQNQTQRLLREVISIYLTDAFGKEAADAVVGETISIGYKHGLYYVTKYNYLEETFII